MKASDPRFPKTCRRCKIRASPRRRRRSFLLFDVMTMKLPVFLTIASSLALVQGRLLEPNQQGGESANGQVSALKAEFGP